MACMFHPDIDIVTYTLAGIANEEKGWGIKGDTFQCLEMLKRFNQETWFALGDRDLATSILRTELLEKRVHFIPSYIKDYA